MVAPYCSSVSVWVYTMVLSTHMVSVGIFVMRLCGSVNVTTGNSRSGVWLVVASGQQIMVYTGLVHQD